MFRCLMTGGALAVVLASAASAAEPPQDLFDDNCSACHQVTGKGVKGAFPALAGSALVKGDKGVLASTVLTGRAGMPAFKDELGDAELAGILTYIRASWGNAASPVTLADIAAARVKSKAARTARGLQAH
jgi:cytochrome c6